jgi:histidinol dehydrogenase
MKVHINPSRTEWPAICTRPLFDNSGLKQKVSDILQDIRINGDEAVSRYSSQFDGLAAGSSFAVSDESIKTAEGKLTDPLKSAIKLAADNIRRFHQSQLQELLPVETMPGVMCWRRSVAIEKVGFYIPGGTAPLFSTVLMLGIPARLAGCKEIILCTPPGKDTGGDVHPAILYAASMVGGTRIFRVGGIQAIGAMAYGTPSIPPVYKIFGPGNQYVNCAKQLVQQDGVAIDMPAGPSEVCVLADESCNPAFVAADLLSQAEHGPDSQVLLLCNSQPLLARIQNEIALQSARLSRKDMTGEALAKSNAVVIDNMEMSIELINQYAPEHLIIACRDEKALGDKIVNAGSVFLGNYSPESVGDYASGTNHVLPTNGFARSYSGVSVDSFVKKITFQQLSYEGLRGIGNSVEEMAAAEGLEAHKNAVSIRLCSKESEVDKSLR